MWVEDASLMIIETSWFAGLSRAFPFALRRAARYHKSLNEGVKAVKGNGPGEGTTLLTVSRYLFLVNPMHLLRRCSALSPRTFDLPPPPSAIHGREAGGLNESIR